MRGTTLAPHFWVFIHLDCDQSHASQVCQSNWCVLACQLSNNWAQPEHLRHNYPQHVSDHTANVHYFHSQCNSSGFPIKHPSTTLFCQLSQPFPQHGHFAACPFWVSYSVKGQEKYKKQEQKFQSFDGKLSLMQMQNLNMQFCTFQSHIRIHETGNNSPLITNVRMALWGTSDLKLIDLAKMVKVISFNDSTWKGPQSPTPIIYEQIFANFVGKHSEQ